ncbi:MAG: tetratricopeptide repeat protein [Spirochaetaceae bacterium]|jgi:tetratricopeptide (TPR) repeat protein|nr:tetratricopeptide repeat protein [Spirochaetaceae bacterium]
MKNKYDEAVRFFNLKRWDSALQTFLLVDTENYSTEQKTELAYYLGLCYTKLERYNDALIYLDQVVSANAGTLRTCQCRLTLAYIYVTTRRPKMAEFELERLVKSGFQSAQISNMMGFAAWAQNETEQAIEYYEKALELDANNPTALNCLGFILAETGTNVQRGIELCKKALDKHPNNAAYMDSIGWAYYKIGEITEARAWLRRALDIAPRQREISAHMKTLVGEAT